MKGDVADRSKVEWFRGVDFSNNGPHIHQLPPRRNCWGECFLKVEPAPEGGRCVRPIIPEWGKSPDGCNAVKATGVDCPFGVARGYQQLLAGEVVDLDDRNCDDEFKSRRTDMRAGKTVCGYKVLKRGLYFHRTKHVQPACGMRTVPGFLHWLLDHELKLTERCLQERRNELVCCRLAENARYVEAHPRLFLYSAIERIWESGKLACLNEDSLQAIAQYKDSREWHFHKLQVKDR